MTSFSPQRLLQALQTLPACQRYLIAYSGGMDSHVLLHAVAAVRESLAAPVLAVHVNHGLSPHAGEWAAHCRRICHELAVPLSVMDIDAAPARGQSPEAAARDARYRAFASFMQQHDCLLTAHHENDQAETLLLQLLRGSGPHGMAAMPDHGPFAAGSLARPLLGQDRTVLLHYARQHHLRWIDDPSNFDTGFNRNFLRHDVLPVMETRWPSWAGTLSRSAQLCADAAVLLDDLAAQDLNRVAGNAAGTLAIAPLMKLGRARQKNVLCYWIRSLSLPLPHHEHVRHILDDMLTAAPDGQPVVHWPGCDVRRYRDHLFAMAPLTPVDPQRVINWDMRDSLQLPDNNGILSLRPCDEGGIDERFFADAEITVRYRRGGEVCRTGVDRHRRPLKKLLQELAVLPWLRDRLPLLYIDDELAAVGNYVVCAPFRSAPGHRGTRLHWLHAAVPNDTWQAE